MKKLNRIVCILLCLVMSLILVACADAGAPDYAADDSSFVVTTESLEQKTQEFAELEDRTTYTDGEYKAAEYLQTRLVEYGYSDASITDFAVVDNEHHVTSYNVEAVYRSQSAGDDAKNIIIGAYYDNRYGATAGYNAAKSTGALGNCTGVAATLAVAEYLKEHKPDLGYTVSIVFFGACAYSTYGAEHYYRDMTQVERANTVLMIELQRLGMEHVYAFSDARETKREAFFDAVAERNKLDIYKATQRTPIITGASVLEGVPYYSWAHSGLFPVFFNSGIPTLNIIGADWETLDLTDNDRITLTPDDTYKNLVTQYPNYADKMAVAVSLVIKSLESDGFIDAMQYDRDNFPDTDILYKNWIWYLVVLCVALLGMLAVNLITIRLGKKYTVMPPAPKTVKMAVFGMDYEDKNGADIFIDIKNSSATDEIFPGIPNNDTPPRSPFDPFSPNGGSVFPFGTPVQTEEPSEKPEVANTPDAPSEPDIFGEESAKPSDKSDKVATDEAAIDTARTTPIEKVENGEQEPTEQLSATEVKEQKPKAKRTAKSTSGGSGTSAKRKTVSAGKSVHGEKPEEKGKQNNEPDAGEDK